MTLAMAKLASFFFTWTGFALLQAVSDGQPLAARLAHIGRHARTGARVGALSCVTVAYLALAPQLGWTEAALLGLVELVVVASAFVLLAPVAPRFTWGLALAAAPAAALLLLAGRWMA